MNKKLFFEIPDDQEVMARLVESVPSNWSWVNGQLSAPQELIVSGQVEEHTGFHVNRFHEIKPTIIGRHDFASGERRKPNLLAIMLEQKLPGFIGFEEAGLDAWVVSLDLAKRVAAGFIRKGYRGTLQFYLGCHNNDMFHNDARCSVILGPWCGAPYENEESGNQPARIKLEWNRWSEENEQVMPIIAVCKLLNFRQYSHVNMEKMDF